jgi:hypothetical protein
MEAPNFRVTSILIKMLQRDDAIAISEYLTKQRQASELQVLFEQLKEIRDIQVKAVLSNDRLQCTGQIQASHCMCLFICGLLRYNSMSFFSLMNGERKKYIDTFFNYMMSSANDKLTITVRKITEDPSNLTADFSNTLVSGARFICASDKDSRNMRASNLLVLDAFSTEDEDRKINKESIMYTKYHPVVWHAYCLWSFEQDTEKRLCSYAVKMNAGTAQSFIFLANYEDHVRTVRLTQKMDSRMAVRALVEQPLELYRTTCLQLNLTPNAVLSRIRHAPSVIDIYKPLAYVHLLVRPGGPLYADAEFQDLETEFAAMVGLKQQLIIDALMFIKTGNECIKRSPVLKASSKDYELLATAHYDLMMKYKFVIPENATQEEILFDTVTQTQRRSPHRDHIAAVCDVRYNWVFDTAHAPVWTPAQPLPSDAPYHQIDVHRHISHLQSAPGAQSDLWKRLSIGFHVTDNAGREGVIVFDVQEQRQLFTGMKAKDLDKDTTLLAFGTGPRETLETGISYAMSSFFTDKNKDKKLSQWSLCDMAYKYVIRSVNNDIFVQDSYALTQGPHPPTCAPCLFCPVCFEPPSALPSDPDAPEPDPMHRHIQKSHDNYYMARFPSSAAASMAGSASSDSLTEAEKNVFSSESNSGSGSGSSVGPNSGSGSGSGCGSNAPAPTPPSHPSTLSKPRKTSTPPDARCWT